ncbi:MAG: SET domain-containing protein-lysine N-methyltransferase [Candidatus Omnitrophica bacterium]|nr:SET domain-containing protein-lysine N-methyltransferase [Candidatus Omnitrophota bacterium]
MKQKVVTSPWIIVRKSNIHSKGVFARKDIPKGTKVIEYVGERITKAESNRRADIPLQKNKKNPDHGAVYIFQLNKRHDIDGFVPYNTARLINHSCDPNCEADIIRGHIWIIALREIQKGEEITYNYNYDIDDYEDHPCRCQTKRCVGYILAEEFWGKLKRWITRKEKKIVKQKKKSAKGSENKPSPKKKVNVR